MEPQRDITMYLARLADGDRAAFDQVVHLLYGELRQLARRKMRHEPGGHTLGATALVNEAYLKLLRGGRIAATDRQQFFAIAANTMHRVLVDYARAKRRHKRGDGEPRVPLEEVEAFLTDSEAEEVLVLDDALQRLAEINPRGADMVRQRFYAGLSLAEIADLHGLSVKTVQRDWIAARAWLHKEVAGDLGL